MSSVLVGRCADVEIHINGLNKGGGGGGNCSSGRWVLSVTDSILRIFLESFVTHFICSICSIATTSECQQEQQRLFVPLYSSNHS